MKHSCLFLCLAFIFAGISVSCSSNGDSEPETKGISGLSFTWDFENDAPYDRTYDVAFFEDGTFEFSATAHGTTGNQFGILFGDYSFNDDAVIFNYSPKGFLVTSSYVKPLSGKLLRDDGNKIVGMIITLLFEARNSNRVSTSELAFYVSNYKPTYTPPEPTNIKEKDLRGTAWDISQYGHYKRDFVLCEDKTAFNIGESWEFDEKTQTVTVINNGVATEYKIYSGNKDEFNVKSNDYEYTWTRVKDTDLRMVYSGVIEGSYKDEKGRTLKIPDLKGSAVPSLPNSTSRRKYESQSMSSITFEGLNGTYKVRFEGKEMDISAFIPMSYEVAGGSIKISNPLKTRKNFKVTLTGYVSGEFTML